MAKKMLINAIDPEECRVAVMENNLLEEFYLESSSTEQLKGNIYRGRVSNIEPSLQACFVDFGDPHDGFLQIDEIHPEYFQEHDERTAKRGEIKRLIEPGQELLVQVVKDASGQKRPTLTTYLSIAGRYTVLMPGRTSGGVSRKIEDEKERERLKEIQKELPVPEEISIILRTAASGKSKRELLHEGKTVLRLWEEIRQRGQEAVAPALIYKEQDLAIRFIRDHFSPEIKEIIIDDKEMYRRAVEFIKIISPRQRNQVKLYKGKEPLFARYNLENQIESIFQNRVSLKSGGSIVIAPTEALISVDVNSGKATREQDLEETAYKTNLEAAEEIVRQLRLRDLGGLVVIDFIDMRDARHRKEVLKRLRDSLKKDRARTRSSGISKFGLVELSRQKMGLPLQQRTYVNCPTCGGKGVVKTPVGVALDHLRKIWLTVSSNQLSELSVRLPVEVATYLLNQKRHVLSELESKHNVSIRILPEPSFAHGDIDQEASKKESGQ